MVVAKDVKARDPYTDKTVPPDQPEFNTPTPPPRPTLRVKDPMRTKPARAPVFPHPGNNSILAM